MKIQEINSFQDFFNSLDQETLIGLAMYEPVKLNKLCMFLALDLQMAEERKEALQKEIKKKLKKKKHESR